MNDVDNIKQRIEKVLDKIRPYLQEDRGDVEFVRYEEDTRVAEVRLLGNCTDCPMVMMTLRAGIERFILEAVPEVRRIEKVR
jgi:Fe-S cluster biogenesis protein NfuA